jgi:hypothetical protein
MELSEIYKKVRKCRYKACNRLYGTDLKHDDGYCAVHTGSQRIRGLKRRRGLR